MKCENCGNENVEIINARKGHYLCGKCGRDTEALYEREHDKEIRAKAIEEFAEKMKAVIERDFANPDLMLMCKQCGIWKSEDIDRIAKEMKGE